MPQCGVLQDPCAIPLCGASFCDTLVRCLLLCLCGALARWLFALRWPGVVAFYGGLERWSCGVALCNATLKCNMLLCGAFVLWSCAVVLCSGAVCVVLIAFISWPRFNCIVSINTDTSANYKCGWIGWKTVPEDSPEPYRDLLTPDSFSPFLFARSTLLDSGSSCSLPRLRMLSREEERDSRSSMPKDFFHSWCERILKLGLTSSMRLRRFTCLLLFITLLIEGFRFSLAFFPIFCSSTSNPLLILKPYQTIHNLLT